MADIIKERIDTGGEATRKLTRTEEVRQRLADDIAEGHLAPGMPIDETEIASRYGVSRTPVREAIRELAAMGLVETRAHRSAVVTRPSASRLREMFEVMAELEALCASLSAVKMSLSEREGLELIHANLGRIVQDNDMRRYQVINEQFHAAIYTGSHNAYLVETTLVTRKRLSPFRRAQFLSAGGWQSHMTNMTRSSRRSRGAMPRQRRRQCAGIFSWSRIRMSGLRGLGRIDGAGDEPGSFISRLQIVWSQPSAESGVESDVDGAKCFRNRTGSLGLVGQLVELRLVDAGDLRLERQGASGYARSGNEFDGSRNFEGVWRSAVFGQHIGELHGKTTGVRGSDQFLGVGARLSALVDEATFISVRLSREGAALRVQRPGPFLQRSIPIRSGGALHIGFPRCGCRKA
jgi:DNA-binding GntR family transcriptional regulator